MKGTGWSEVSFLDPFQKVKEVKTITCGCFRLSRATSEGGMLICLWVSSSEYIELLWETSVTSLSPNTALNQLSYALN